MADGYKLLQQNAAQLSAAEHSFNMQHAKVGYFKQVDRNSAYFHSLVKRNNRQNEITAVEKLDGDLTTSFEEMVQIFKMHFQTQLGTTSSWQPLSQQLFQSDQTIIPDQIEQLTYLLLRKSRMLYSTLGINGHPVQIAMGHSSSSIHGI